MKKSVAAAACIWWIYSINCCVIIPRRAIAFTTTTPPAKKTHPSTTTSLNVSELHVPGYAQSKLAFILPEDDDEIEEETSSPLALAQERSQLLRDVLFSLSDYSSLIPHQNGYLLHKSNKPIFTPEECQFIINEAEYTASTNNRGWTTKRHGNYPTTDLPLSELPNTLQFFRYALFQRIYPLLRHQFGVYLPDGGKNLRVADGFVVKYDAEDNECGQKELKPHRDGSILSFNILLNQSSEFDGGGTWFASLNDVVTIEQGMVLSHSSSLLHGGHGITRGRRYIMVCFVILEGYDSWSMRFYNQVRNL